MTQSENTAGITITPAARAHIRNQLTQTQAGYLRLGVKRKWLQRIQVYARFPGITPA